MPKRVRANITKARLTEAKATAEQSGKLVRLWDAAVPGLGARIQPTGSLSWFVRYASNDGGGVEAWRDYKLRHAEELPLDTVRSLARTVLAGIAAGDDPLDARESEREAPSMSDAYGWWLESLEGKVKPSTLTEYQRQWDKELADKLGREKVKDITPLHLRSLLAAVSKGNPKKGFAGRPILANRMRSRLHTFFRWCEREGYRAQHTNPVTDVVERTPEREKERFLSSEQITALLAAIARAEREGLPVAESLKAKSRGKSVNRPSRAAEMRARRAAKLGVPVESLPPAREYTLRAPRSKRGRKEGVTVAPKPANATAVAALRFLLWSGWREQEVLTLRWDAIDKERSAANLSDTKTGDSWRPLAPFLVEFLSELPKRSDEFVFAGKKKGQPLREIRHLWYAVREAAGLDGVRLHDLRHTNASVMISAGAPLAVVGAALGHRDMKSTQRYAKLHGDVVSAAQQRAIEDMRAWASGRETPVTPLPLRKGS